MLENIHGLMDQLTKASGKTTKLMDSEPTFGKTAANTSVSGLTTTCRVTVSTSTRMEFVMTDST